MAKIFPSVSDIIGNTPLILLSNLKKSLGLCGNIIAKLESSNPGGSAKDRVAKQMLEDVEKHGLITKDSVIIEPTSGNTGVGLCMLAAARGYRIIIVMPETMSEERKKLMRAYGAELVLTDGKKGMAGAIEKAEELAKEIPNSFIPGQFTNPSNPKAHFDTTGPEIFDDTNGKIDVFVASVGTGGTITGVGQYLKSKKPDVKVYAVEPKESPVLSGGKAGAHGIQGIGAGFIPEVLDTTVYDDIFTVLTEDAMEAARLIAKTEGILVGISSGAALSAAIQLAGEPENSDKNIVVLLPDTGERYLSTTMFS
ncbi:MAG: cysteine synthase A [Clostridia bacterium]|nr:cysteine synthase A [Clostridia bacterium]